MTEAPTPKGSVGAGCALLLLGSCIAIAMCPDPSPQNDVSNPPTVSRPPSFTPDVTQATFSGRWPLTVMQVQFVCEIGGFGVFVRTPDGRTWPLNGIADSHAGRLGYEPSIDPIWQLDRALMREIEEAGADPIQLRVNIGDLIDAGLRFCDGR